jgi:N6-adenosine-specific RNA methylase IME4
MDIGFNMLKKLVWLGIKGDLEIEEKMIPDVIFSLRRGQSQKPEEIYQMIEEIVPGWMLFGDFWKEE